MIEIHFTGWRPGFQKVRFNKLLRDELQIPLADAFDVVSAILENHPVTLRITNASDAETVLRQAEALGVIGSISPEEIS
jgi:hypothetical protein